MDAKPSDRATRDTGAAVSATLFYAVMGALWLFGLVVGRRLKATYSRYSRVPNQVGLRGADVARQILDANGLENVRLALAPGKLTDHYDPRTLSISLSAENAEDASVAAMAVSAHEAAHALQDKDDYSPLELRSSIYPIVQAGSRFGTPLAVLGSMVGSNALFLVGMAGYLGGTLFHFVTLPVEFNASRRALAQLQKLGITRGEQEVDGVRATLRAAAMTYVAGAASAAGYVLLTGADVFRAFTGGRRRRPA
jgi:Zn-dependent membrane protease YugP